MRTVLIVLAAALTLAVSAPALAASNPRETLCTKAWPIRHAVIKHHGKRAPGRNICRQGIRRHDGSTYDASTRQKARYIRAMRRLLLDANYLNYSAGPPPVPPAGTMTARASPVGLAACIVRSESGGNPNANNGSHFGIAQWTIEAWLRHGGGRFASSPLGATYQEQLQVLDEGLSRFGCRDWCPFDPC